MNLHEECLLKYLLNPIGLALSTESLRQSNELITKNLKKKGIIANVPKVSYSTNSY